MTNGEKPWQNKTNGLDQLHYLSDSLTAPPYNTLFLICDSLGNKWWWRRASPNFILRWESCQISFQLKTVVSRGGFAAGVITLGRLDITVMLAFTDASPYIDAGPYSHAHLYSDANRDVGSYSDVYPYTDASPYNDHLYSSLSPFPLRIHWASSAQLRTSQSFMEARVICSGVITE